MARAEDVESDVENVENGLREGEDADVPNGEEATDENENGEGGEEGEEEEEEYEIEDIIQCNRGYFKPVCGRFQL